MNYLAYFAILELLVNFGQQPKPWSLNSLAPVVGFVELLGRVWISIGVNGKVVV